VEAHAGQVVVTGCRRGMPVLRTVNDTHWMLCLWWVVVQATLLELAGARAHVKRAV
jgi:hypothetical protein